MRPRRGSFNAESIHPFPSLSKSEQHELMCLFKKVDQREGGITFYDFIQILKTIGPISEGKKKEILNQISAKGVKILDHNYLLSTAAALKKQKQSSAAHQQLGGQFFDTFVALGGNVDGSGYITRDRLLSTMMKQFQLDVDLDTVDLKGLGQDRLSYREFCQLFENPESTLLRTDSTKSVKINEQQFNAYLSKLAT